MVDLYVKISDPMMSFVEHEFAKVYDLDNRTTVTTALLSKQGLELRNKLLASHEEEPCLSDIVFKTITKFGAKDHWARAWAHRNNLKGLRAQELASRQRFLELKLRVETFGPANIYSMSATTLFYGLLPQRGGAMTFASGLTVQQLYRCKPATE